MNRARRGGLEPEARSLNRHDPAIARSAWDLRRGANLPDSKEGRLRRRSQATRASLTPARPSQICRSGGNRIAHRPRFAPAAKQTASSAARNKACALLTLSRYS